MVKDITQLGQPADVLGVADYSLIPKLMSDPSKPHATWYLGFVSNQITFAYTSRSKGASQLSASNWYKVLAEPGVHIGRSNPAADPSGYQILQMLQLAHGYYMAAAYAKVTIHAGSLGALTAKPIIYGLTIPSTAPDAALGQKFISFVLSPQGQAIMSSNGFVVISPALASSQASLPAPLRTLTTPWPASGG